MSDEGLVERWGILDRITHMLNLLGFIIALISGLPQLQLTIFGLDIGRNFTWLTEILGGEGVRRILHRYVVTALVGIAITTHILNFGLRKTRSNILLTYSDFRDLILYYRSKLVGGSKPYLGFHVPGEKLLYWIAVVCLPVLGFTGIIMWLKLSFIEYHLLRLLHRTAFLILTIFVMIHFILNMILPEQWKALKAMFTNGRVERKWIETHHPRTLKEEQIISAARRRTIRMFLWAIPLAGLAYIFSITLQRQRFEIGNILIEPSKPMLGKPFTVSVEVSNAGYVEDSVNLRLTIDGKLLAEKQITLLDGETSLVSFQATMNELGKHTLEVNGFSKTFEVVEALPPIDPEVAERFKKILPEAFEFAPVIKEGKILYYEIYDEKGSLIAYGFDERVYAPTDRLRITGIIGLDYKIRALDVDRLQPDIQLLRDEIIEPAFENQFIGLRVEDLYLSPQGKIDAVSGATISSTRIVETVRKILSGIQQSS